MANIKSKKKNIKKIAKQTERNRAIKSSTRKAIKKAREAILSKDKSVTQIISIAKKTINIAVSKGVFHKNNGARKQSKLDAFYAKNN